ncbi:MAG: hypothetical protein ABH814_03335 [bacterium]
MNRKIFWSNPKIDLKDPKNLPYIAHQTLMFGSLKDINKLFTKFGKAKIKETFTKKPMNIYSRPAFKFTKEILLNIKSKGLDEKKYVKSLF